MKASSTRTNSIMIMLLLCISGVLSHRCETYINYFQNYECVDKNGIPFASGAFEQAFRVKDKQSQKMAIMKLPILSTNAQYSNVELQIMQTFNGEDNIIQLLGSQKTGFMTIKLIEYAENGDLKSYLEKHKNISYKDILTIFRGVANGIKNMHDKNYAHLDLKLENVVLMDDLTPKLIDFGLSNQVGQYGVTRGTPIYLPFEMFNMNRVKFTKEMDMYSLGILLYEMVYKGEKIPFYENMQDLLLSKTHGVYIVHKGMPTEILDIINHLFLRDPEERININQLLNKVDKAIQDNAFTEIKYDGYYGEEGDYRGMVFSKPFLLCYDFLVQVILVLVMVYVVYNKYNILHSNKQQGFETELETEVGSDLA